MANVDMLWDEYWDIDSDIQRINDEIELYRLSKTIEIYKLEIMKMQVRMKIINAYLEGY